MPSAQTKYPASMPDRQEQQFPETIEVRRSHFSGPIPPPSVLAHYESVLPGLAERLLAMAEDEARHRRATWARVIRLSEWGLISAVVLGLTIVLCGTVAAVRGAEMAGLAAVVATVAGLVAVFLSGRSTLRGAKDGADGGGDEIRPVVGR